MLDLNPVGLHIYSPTWLKTKKAIINPKNKDNKCFQYVTKFGWDYQEIPNPSERIINLL